MVPSVSAIIPSFGKGRFLARCIEALESQTVPVAEIIICHSGEVELCPEAYSLANAHKLIRVRERLFPGGARNFGAKHAASDYLLFVDSDAIAKPNLLASFLARLPFGEDCLLIGSIGATESGGYWGLCQYLTEFSTVMPSRPSRAIARIGAACNFFIKKSSFLSHGFRDDILASEDSDFFARVLAAGKHIFFVTEAEVDHCNEEGFVRNRIKSSLLGEHATIAYSSIYGSTNWRNSPLVASFYWLLRFNALILRILASGVNRRGALISSVPGCFILLACWGHAHFRESLRLRYALLRKS